MAHAYTPGLKVAERVVVRKERRLPLKGDVLFKEGDVVRATDVVARTELPGKVYPLNLANVLGVGPETLEQHMVVPTGGAVAADGILAQTPGFMGFFKAEARSPVAGTVESVSRVTGQVILQAAPIPVEISAYINGTVVEVFPEEGVTVETEAAFVQGIFGLGGEVYAPLKALATSPNQVIDARDITPEHKGHILIGGAFLTHSAVKRAIEVGVAGLVTGGFHFQDIKDILGYEVGVAITGTEQIGLTLMLTEGFGNITMAQATFDLLNTHVGKKASLNGATQIRAGVIRPEVIVTHAEPALDHASARSEVRGTEVGDLIRGIRAPYFGRIGKVVDLPVELRTMESETRVRVMVVEFEDGQRVELPRSNVEMIER